MKNKILLVDGNLLLFKSFYATFYLKNKLVNVNNIETSAVHTFMISLVKIFKLYQPTHCFIAFDTGKKTKRHEIYQEYKAGRIKVPMEIFEQKKIIIEILDIMNLKHFDLLGYEGDDLIASLTTKFSNENEILIWSDDQDLLQLIDTNVSVIVKNYKTKKFMIKNLNNFKEIHGFEHYQIPDYKAISGDKSDNLPGVKGIGSMGAIKLLNKYQSLENIYQNLDQLTLSEQDKFLTHKNMALLCKKLATLELFIDLNFNLNDLVINNFRNHEVEQVLLKYELKTIYKLLFID